MPLEIVRNDITTMKVDVIVNSAHPTASVGGGVDLAIHRAAGPELLGERMKIGDIATGDAFITPAFRLPAKYVVHTVGPIWQDGKKGQRELLASCYTNSLRLAVENHCESIAFPLISAGVFACPAEIAIATAVQAIREFLAEHELTVYLVIFNRSDFKISTRLFDDVKKCIDERYVEDLFEDECTGAPPEFLKGNGVPSDGGEVFEALEFDEMICANEDAKEKRRIPKQSAKRKVRKISDEAVQGDSPLRICESFPPFPIETEATFKPRSLLKRLKKTDATFSEALLRLISAKGKTDPEIYKRANVDRKHFAKIRKNPNYQPSKTTALAFAVALELNLDEAKDFIGRAGYALSHSSKTDIIVEYFIEREEYDIFTINETLFAFGQPCLG